MTGVSKLGLRAGLASTPGAIVRQQKASGDARNARWRLPRQGAKGLGWGDQQITCAVLPYSTFTPVMPRPRRICASEEHATRAYDGTFPCAASWPGARTASASSAMCCDFPQRASQCRGIRSRSFSNSPRCQRPPSSHCPLPSDPRGPARGQPAPPGRPTGSPACPSPPSPTCNDDH